MLVGGLVAGVVQAQDGLHEAVVAFALAAVGPQGGEFDDRPELGVLELAGGEAVAGRVGPGAVAQAGEGERLEVSSDGVRAGGGSLLGGADGLAPVPSLRRRRCTGR